MRIAFVKQKYVEFGGGERYLARLMESCADTGDDVHLVTTGWSSERELPIRVHMVPNEGITLARRAVRFSRNVEALLKREAFDLSFSLERTCYQDVWRAGEGVHRVWLERRRSIEPRIKTLFNPWNPRHNALLRLEAECVRRTPCIIANSHMVKNDLRSVYGDRAGAIEVIYNGVDPHRFSPDGWRANREKVRAELAIGPDRPLLLLVGSGLSRKGLREQLAAMKLLSDCVLIVMGRDAGGRWQRLAERMGVAERVRFLQPRSDLAPCLHAADLVVLPSWFDPFPNAGLEALFCGTPLLTTRFAGVHEVVIPGDSGEIVDSPADIPAIARGVERQLAMGNGSERRLRIVRSVQEYTIENNRSKTLALLKNFFE